MDWKSRLWRLYWSNPQRIDERGLTNAVTRGWITTEDKAEIMAGPPDN